MTASDYLVKHRPSQPSQPQGGAVRLSLAFTKKIALDSGVGGRGGSRLGGLGGVRPKGWSWPGGARGRKTIETVLGTNHSE